MVGFWAQYWDVIAFYVLAVLLIYIFRRKFIFQGIIALLKTQFGVKWMTQTGKKHPKLWDRVGLVAIIIGFIGMVFIVGYLLWGLYALIFVPTAPPALSPVIPGVKIPGVPFTFPLWYTLLALFFSVIVHESMHGVLASAYNIPIRSSGFAFIGPIPGAFVEPDEKIMRKRSARERLAILAGGPFANIILAAIALLLMFSSAFVANNFLLPDGVHIGNIKDGSPALLAGIPANTTITAIDGTQVNTTAQLVTVLAPHHPGDTIIITASGTQYRTTLAASPDDAKKPFIGVLEVSNATHLKNPSMGWLHGFFVIMMNTFLWTYIISLGIGIANLIPIGPIDGGQMLRIALEKKFGEERTAGIFSRWSFLLLFLVLILVFVPILKAIF